MVFKILNGMSPSYLSELLHVHTTVRELRSCDQLLLDVPRSRLKNKGDRACAVVAPYLWNSLPIITFKSLLKTYLFCLGFQFKLSFEILTNCCLFYCVFFVLFYFFILNFVKEQHAGWIYFWINTLNCLQRSLKNTYVEITNEISFDVEILMKMR